jgi:HSP20 family protein
MSNLTRWEPMREMMTLREAMDRLFDDAFTRPINLRDGGWSAPAVDMYQTDDEVVVRAALPGFKADEVQINVTGDVLTPGTCANIAGAPSNDPSHFPPM